MQEREFFSSDDVYVSLTRFVVHGQTYAMSGVTSVKAHTIAASQLLPVLTLLLALFCVFFGPVGIVCCLVCLVMAGVLWATQKQDHVVLLSTSSGEVKALRSDDKQYISSVVQALNDCIVARG